jgi:hypothetical protein
VLREIAIIVTEAFGTSLIAGVAVLFVAYFRTP